ncbi:MAG: aromatic amino acid transport family protein [bacterium]|nr:aromatic amino acid transport family protein [bacterium]
MKFIKALAVLLGTIIGVGIFGLPYAASKAGLAVMFFYLIIMSALIAKMHLIYADIIAEDNNNRRLPGFVGEYLGSFWKYFVFLVIAVGMTGSSIAYLIIGGEFLHYLLSPLLGGAPILYSLLFFALGSLLVFKGIKTIANLEIILSMVLLAILFFISWKAVPFINIGNFASFSPQFILFPYGIVIFSLWGSNAIPELKEIAGKGSLKKIILAGVFASALVYLIFIAAVLGVSGTGVSKDAISGLLYFLGPGVLGLGFIFGVISCFTSYITLSLSFKKTLWYDLKLNKNISWAAASFVPLILFLFGIKRFIPVMNFTGAVSLGLESFVLIILYRAFLKKKFGLKINPLYYILAVVFAAGAAFEIFNIFVNI